MSSSGRLLLSASYFQTIATASRHQLRIRRRPVHFSSASRIQHTSRLFSSSTRWRKDDTEKTKKDDGAATLPEETSNIARAADEPPKPSDLEAVPEDVPASELAEAIESSSKKSSTPQLPQADDGAATLPEETSTIARAADEPPKPSDLEVIPENVPASELADAIEDAKAERPKAESSQIDDGSATLPEEVSTIARAADEPPKPSDLDSSGGHTPVPESKEQMRWDIADAAQQQELDNAGIETANILQLGASEEHQDLREYARLAAWELPLLHKLAKPFTPPTSSQLLRFRYTSYMGDEHPASKKVVVEFDPFKLPGLNEKQQIKLIKLAGTRYNPEKKIIKMSCESFEEPAQNKRYLGDLIQKLMTEAKDGKDTFEDVPVDLRHHKLKPNYKFPEEWKIKPSARILAGKGMRGQGAARREAVKELSDKGELIDGEQVMKNAMLAMPVQRPKLASQERVLLGSKTGKAPVRKRGPASSPW